jgi:hypothetical protein
LFPGLSVNMVTKRFSVLRERAGNLKPGSGDANTLKTYITEKFAAGEARDGETPTIDARKVRFMGRQLPAYRFNFCVLNGVVAGYDDVVRHRCNNRRCLNPEHLEIGSRGENLQTSVGHSTLCPIS